MLKITWDYNGMKSQFYVEEENIIIGRPALNFHPAVSLSLDLRVAARHARLWK